MKDLQMQSVFSRVFINGNSQAVRIPQEFRLEASRVEIRRTSDGDLLIHPLPTARGSAILEALAGFDDDFIAALELGQAETSVMQERNDI